MGKRKSTAQLKRLQKRAEQRGETYDVVEETVEDVVEEPVEDEVNGIRTSSEETTTATTDPAAESGVDDKNIDSQHKNEEAIMQDELPSKRLKVNADQDCTKQEKNALIAKKMIAMELKQEIQSIEQNEQLKAKERRTAKRKAEAIAVEKAGVVSAQELLDWLETYESTIHKEAVVADAAAAAVQKKKDAQRTSSLKTRSQTPNILFIGQLTFDTTKEEILECFRKHLKDTEKMTIADSVLSVRLLTHAKNGKSKGMAFLEIKDTDPKILFSCLKLHHTYLNGRRINVERTSGGGKVTKQTKVATLRKNQLDYMKETVQTILAGYDTSSLDEGVLALCERHNATVVHAGMERFVETDGPNKDNPSAYLTALLEKLAKEGIFDRTKKDETRASTGRSNRGNIRDRRKGR